MKGVTLLSDDFFEDDVVEEKPAAAKKSAPKKGNMKAAAAKAAKGGDGGGISNSFNIGINVDLTWVVIIAIAALAIGWMGHAAFLGRTVDNSTSVQYNSSGQAGSAPALSQQTLDQYKKNGTLPSGHPNISGSGTTTGTASGSQAPATGSTGK
ncbi:MAG: hypothetical protein M1335_02160 [Chloroflexi bacterium]|nr:hypothetical protein [Chloroflexota bacterium]